MDGSTELCYKPPPDFEVNKRGPLDELKLSNSTELWLIQLPLNHSQDFDGKEVTLKLNDDGNLGSFESSSGKSYDVIELTSQGPEPLVFLSSAPESKVVGKISRHLSFLHYPEPSEFEKLNKMSLKEVAQRSSTMMTNSTFRHSSATKSSKRTHSQATSIFTSSTPSSRHKGSSSKLPSKSPKETSGSEPNSTVTSGSLGNSQERKSKKSRNN